MLVIPEQERKLPLNRTLIGTRQANEEVVARLVDVPGKLCIAFSFGLDKEKPDAGPDPGDRGPGALRCQPARLAVAWDLSGSRSLPQMERGLPERARWEVCQREIPERSVFLWFFARIRSSLNHALEQPGTAWTCSNSHFAHLTMRKSAGTAFVAGSSVCVSLGR